VNNNFADTSLMPYGSKKSKVDLDDSIDFGGGSDDASVSSSPSAANEDEVSSAQSTNSDRGSTATLCSGVEDGDMDMQEADESVVEMKQRDEGNDVSVCVCVDLLYDCIVC